jgi:hypothetical protein
MLICISSLALAAGYAASSILMLAPAPVERGLQRLNGDAANPVLGVRRSAASCAAGRAVGDYGVAGVLAIASVSYGAAWLIFQQGWCSRAAGSAADDRRCLWRSIPSALGEARVLACCFWTIVCQAAARVSQHPHAIDRWVDERASDCCLQRVERAAGGSVDRRPQQRRCA